VAQNSVKARNDFETETSVFSPALHVFSSRSYHQNTIAGVSCLYGIRNVSPRTRS